MSDALLQLKERLSRVVRLGQICALMDWDQQTYMPTGAAEARGEQTAALREVIHNVFVASETGDLLCKVEAELAESDPDGDDVRMASVVRRDYDRAIKVPTSLVMEMSRHTAVSHEAWVRARAASDYATFAPMLARTLELTRQVAECYGYAGHIYDALLEGYEPGLTQADASRLFTDLKPHLLEIVQRIAKHGNRDDDKLLTGAFPVDRQRALTLGLVQDMGFDLTYGRQDEAAHPFCSNFSKFDVRITTRFSEECLSQALYACLHETGHALYELGSPTAYEGTFLAGACSLGVHESQSRMWENLVGRSLAYCTYLAPKLAAAFPESLAGVRPEALYRAVNIVRPSLIRVEADEVTYNLHVLIRFELECELLTGRLSVSDLPDAWNNLYEQYLGVRPQNDAVGVLQDVHWSAGLVGYFPTYTLGNVMSGQLWAAANRELPELAAQIAAGEFHPLLDWLRLHVHEYGRKLLPAELVLRATGEELTSSHYISYLKTKYAGLYDL